MKKVALFGFNGELMCFAHVLLNAFDMQERGYEVTIVIEGSATKLIRNLDKPEAPFSNLYRKAKESGLIAGTCKACTAKMGTLAEAEAQNLPLLGDMSGHPSISSYMEQGYTVLTF
jgi:hypothetical protein